MVLVVISVVGNNTSKFVYQLIVTQHFVICLVRITAPYVRNAFPVSQRDLLYLHVTSWSLSIWSLQLKCWCPLSFISCFYMLTTFAFCWLSFSPNHNVLFLHFMHVCHVSRGVYCCSLGYISYKSCKIFNVHRTHVSGDKQEVNTETTTAVGSMTFLLKKTSPLLVTSCTLTRTSVQDIFLLYTRLRNTRV